MRTTHLTKIVALANQYKHQLKLALVFCAGAFVGVLTIDIDSQGKLDQVSAACANGGWIFDANGNKYTCKFVGK